MKYTIVIASLFLSCSIFHSSIYAQDLKTQAYKAYIDSDLNQWKSIVEEYDKKSDANDDFEFALTQYGLIALSLFTSNEKMFDAYVPLAHDFLDELIDENESWAEPYAVSSFIMGFQIANSPIKGVYLGPKSMSRMSVALELDNQSPVVIQLYAGSKYFSPKFFGGDVDEAIENYLIAIELFEKESRTDEWLYLDALAFLGKSYMRVGETKKAITIYEKALVVEPAFNWVKKQLLPEAKQSLSITN